MSKQAKWPKRGEISADRRFYTLEGNTPGDSSGGVVWDRVNDRKVEGAYVPSDSEQKACDMARKQIYRCAYMARLVNCKNCEFFKAKKCDARLFLAAHHQPDAWEVKP